MSVTDSAQSRDMTDGRHSSSLETDSLQSMPHLGFWIHSQTHVDDRDGASLHSGMDAGDEIAEDVRDGASLHSFGMDVSDAGMEGVDAATQRRPMEGLDATAQTRPRMEGVDAATQMSPMEGLDATTQTRPMQSVDRTTQTSPMDWNAHRDRRPSPVSCLTLLTFLIADMEVEINDLQRHVDRDADSGGGYIFIPQTVSEHSCSMLRRLERMRGLLTRFDDD